MITDHAYAELGLPIGASAQAVKAAWRRLVSQWHPDRNASASAVAKIQRINQAFEAIRRAQPPQPGTTAPDEAPTAAPADDPAPPASADAAPAPPPIRRKVKLTLEEAAAGCIRQVRGQYTLDCTLCAGAGHQLLDGACTACDGAGSIEQRSIWFGWPGVRSTCEACLGGGSARRTCPGCEGKGQHATRYQVQVRIPHGVRDGDLLHVDAGRAGGAPADLEIRVQIAPHALFHLHEDGSVRCEMPVNGFAWIANRSVQVPTLAGPQTLQLDRAQLSYRLAGQGFPTTRRGARGDHWITLVPVFPPQFSTDHDILLDQLIAATSGAGAHERLQAWNERLAQWERALAG